MTPSYASIPTTIVLYMNVAPTVHIFQRLAKKARFLAKSSPGWLADVGFVSGRNDWERLQDFNRDVFLWCGYSTFTLFHQELGSWFEYKRPV